MCMYAFLSYLILLSFVFFFFFFFFSFVFSFLFFFFFQAEDGIRDPLVTGVQTCALPISVRTALDAEGLSDVILEEVLSPPWTSAWLTDEGRQKLRSFGIAPPEETVASPDRKSVV